VLAPGSAAACLCGIWLAFRLYLRAPAAAKRMPPIPGSDALRRLWLGGWGFDWLYGRLFVQPVAWVARVNKDDVLDLPFRAIAWLSELCHRLLSLTQTGRLRWYAACLAAGAVAIVTTIGASRDLPADGVVGVDPSVSAGELAGEVGALLADPVRRRDLAAAARTFAAAHSYAVVARQLFERVIEPATATGLSVTRLG
jgi:hypothetical protein